MTDNKLKQLNQITNVSHETYNNLCQFAALLKAKNNQLNLIGRGTIDNIWERHILDSAQLVKYLNKKCHIIDFGSGAGLPALILSLLGFKVISVESITKKADFQHEIAKLFNLDIKIINDRIENIVLNEDYILTARAVAPLNKLFSLSANLLSSGRKAYFLKGKNYQKELNIAQKFWHFKYNHYKSLTSDESVILEIYDLKWK